MSLPPFLIPFHSVPWLSSRHGFNLRLSLLGPRSDNIIDILPIRLLAMALFQEYLILHLQQLLLMAIRRRLHRFPRFAHPIHDIPQGLGVAMLVRRGGLGAQHGGAVHHRGVDVLRDQDGHVAGRGHEFHQDAILALGAGHEDGFDLVAGLVHGLDDLVGLQRDEFHGGVVVERQPIDGFVGGEADGGAGHARVGDGGAVTEEVAVEEEVAA